VAGDAGCYRLRVTQPTETTSIRRLRAPEWQLLRALRLRSLEDAPEAFGQPLTEAAGLSTLEWQRKTLQSSSGDDRSWLVAQRGRDMIGLVHGRRRSPATLLLFSMWVDPRSRRSGVGRQLIESLEAWAVGWGAQETVLWVLQDNQRALGFYRRLGFEVIETGRDAEAGTNFGALALRRTIGSDDAR
jgi:ribosomal protein S18 acetylase RimI-like enzyme